MSTTVNNRNESSSKFAVRGSVKTNLQQKTRRNVGQPIKFHFLTVGEAQLILHAQIFPKKAA